MTHIKLKIEPVIHHHFKLAKNLFQNPCRFNVVKFKSIPLFRLYPMLHLTRIQEIINLLSCCKMPKAYQKIINELNPPTHIADSGYREELIKMRYCEYNKQGFFVRAYRLRQNDFFKLEITLHSGTLGRGKYYSLGKAYKTAVNIFSRIEADKPKNLNPDGLHADDYVYFCLLDDEVRAYNQMLIKLKETNNAKEREFLKDKFIKQIRDFEENYKDTAKNNLEIQRTYALTTYNYANQNNQ